MSNSENPIDIQELWAAINRHPDYRGGVIWVRKDIEMVANEQDIDPDELDEAINFDGWEEMATSHGFDNEIADAVHYVKTGEE